MDQAPADQDSTWATHAAGAANTATLTALTTTDPTGLTGPALLDAITASEKALSLLTGIQLRLLAAFAEPFTAGDPTRLATRLARKNRTNPDPTPDDIEHLIPDAAISLAATEVAAALRISPVTAGLRVREARTMTSTLAPTLRSLEHGTLDRGKARVIAEHCQVLTPEHTAAVQHLVLPTAGDLTTSELRDITGQAVITIDPHGADERHHAAAARRDLALKALPDAMATLSAYLPADGAVKIFQISDLLATSTAAAPGDTRGIGARRVDALVDIADHLLTHGHLDLTGYLGDSRNEPEDPTAGPDDRTSSTGPITNQDTTGDAEATTDPDDHADQTAGPDDRTSSTGPITNRATTGGGNSSDPTDTDLTDTDTGATEVTETRDCADAGTETTGNDTDGADHDPDTGQPDPAADPDPVTDPDPAKKPVGSGPPTPAHPPTPTKPPTGTSSGGTGTGGGTGGGGTSTGGCGCGPGRPGGPGTGQRRTRTLTRQGRRPHLSVSLGLGTLAGLDNLPGFLAGYGAIPPGLARSIAISAATITTQLVDHDTGIATHAGTLTYRPRQDLRDQIAALLGTCQFPSCRQPVWRCDIDHLEPFDHTDPGNGGHTDSKNTGPYCRRHHLIKHHTDWRIRPDRDTYTLHFTSPTGHSYTKHRTPTTPPRIWLETPGTAFTERLENVLATTKVEPAATTSSVEELLTTTLLRHHLTSQPMEYAATPAFWDNTAQGTPWNTPHPGEPEPRPHTGDTGSGTGPGTADDTDDDPPPF